MQWLKALLFPLNARGVRRRDIGTRSRSKERIRRNRRSFFEQLEDRTVLTTVGIDLQAGSSIAENSTGTLSLVVWRDVPSMMGLTVNYTIGGTAANGTDYSYLSGSAIIGMGATQTTVVIDPDDDSSAEGDEAVSLTLQTSMWYTIDSNASSQTVTITDDEAATSTLSVANAAAVEGSDVVFQVTLSAAATSTVTVSYATSDGLAEAGTDYTAASGSLTFTPGQTVKTVPVSTTYHSTSDGDRSFNLTLSNPQNADLSAQHQTAVGTISDLLPLISVGNASADEGQDLVFTITLAEESDDVVVVSFETSDGSATSPGDYAATLGSVTINPGDTEAEVHIAAKKDSLIEAAQDFELTLLYAVNATIDEEHATGIGTINNIAPVSISIRDAAGTEGGDINFQMTLSEPSDESISVYYETDTSGLTNAAQNYVPSMGTVTFAPGQTSQVVPIPTFADDWRHASVEFNLRLFNATNATIADTIGLATVADAPEALISISDASIMEGSNLVFTATLSRPFTTSFPISFSAVNGSAGAADIGIFMPTFSFAIGETTKQLSIPTVADGVTEGDEQFALVLSSTLQSNLNVAIDPVHGSGTGSILENQAPTISRALPPIAVPTNANATAVDLASVFIDREGGTLALSVSANNNTSLVSASVVNSVLSLTYSSGVAGTASLLVRATDASGLYSETPLEISVAVNNTNPTFENLPDISVPENSSPSTIDLSDYFDDQNDSAPDLGYFASSTNPTVAVVEVDNETHQLTLSYPVDASGESLIIVGAVNSLGLHNETQFHVEVLPVNQAPQATTFHTIWLNQNSGEVRLSLTSLFTDSDDVISELTTQILQNTNTDLVAVTVDANTAELVLTPEFDAAGDAAISIRVTDSGSLFATTSLSVHVDARPEVTLPGNFAISVDTTTESVSFDTSLYVTDDSAGDLTYDIDDYSSDFVYSASVDPSSGAMSAEFFPEATGTGFVAVRATDASGNSSLVTVPITRSAPGGGGEGDGEYSKPKVWLNTLDGKAQEPNDSGTLQIVCTGGCAGLRVDYAVSGTATFGTDYVALPDTTVTPPTITGFVILTGASANIVITPKEDVDVEGPETVIITLAARSSYDFEPSTNTSGTVTILDSVPTQQVWFQTADNSNAFEGGQNGRLAIKRNSSTGRLVVSYGFDFCNTPPNQNGVACPNDITASTTVTFNPGELVKYVSVTATNDTNPEGPETLSAHLNPGPGYTLSSPDHTSITLNDNDVTVSVIGTRSASESGQVGEWKFTRSNTNGSLTVNYQIGGCPSPSSACAADYTSPAATGTVTFAAGNANTTLSLTAFNDAAVEATEYLVLTVTSGTGYIPAAGNASQAGVGITDNDTAALPKLKLDSPAAVVEGDKVTFTATLSAASASPVTFYYFTSDVTATSPQDYSGISSSPKVTINPGSLTASIDIPTLTDSICEVIETFSLGLVNVMNATLETGGGLGSIKDYDDLPTVSVGNVTVVEGVTANFPVTLSRACVREFGLPRHTLDGTAFSTPANVSDYNALATAEFVMFPANTTSVTVPVTTIDDSRPNEGSETFYLKVGTTVDGSNYVSGTGTITDNDVSLPTISIDDVSVVEGNSGTTVTALFTVTISASPASSVTVNYVTQDGSAQAASPETDYNAISAGSLTFSNGASKTIAVTVNGDGRKEFDENFSVVLSLGSGSTAATISKSVGVGTIKDDDQSADAHLILHKAHCACSCTTCDSNGQVTEVINGGFDVSLNEPMAPSYFADGTFNTNPIFNVVMKLPANSAVPTRIEATPTVGTLVGDTKSFSPANFVAGNEVEFAVQMDLASLPSAAYPLTIDIKAYFSDGKTAKTKLEDEFVLNNLLSSPFGQRWWLDGLTRLVFPKTIPDGNGGNTTLGPAGVGLIEGNNAAWWFKQDGTSYAPPTGQFSTLTKNGNGTYEVRGKYGDKQFFTAEGRLTQKRDANGNNTNFVYDADGKLQQITDPFGRVTRYTYQNQKLSTVTDYAGRTTTFANSGTLITYPPYTEPNGTVVQATENFAYDASGRLTSHTDTRGKVSTYTYDSDDKRFKTSTKPDNGLWQVEIAQRQGLPESGQGDPQHPLPMRDPKAVFATAIDARNNATSLRVDDYGNLLEKVDALGNRYLMERDPRGLLTKSILPDPDKTASTNGPLPDLITTYAYDNKGNLTSMTLPDASTWRWQYDASFSQVTQSGLLNPITGLLEQVVNFVVNATNGNVESETHIMRSTAAGPGYEGNPAWPWQNPRNKYDVNSDGLISSADVDAIFNSGFPSLPSPPTSQSSPPPYLDADGNGACTAADALLVINFVNAILPITTIYTYTGSTDAVPDGMPLTVTDPNGRVTQYAYFTAAGQNFGRLQSVTAAAGLSVAGVVQFEYDIAGNVKATIDPLGRRNEFTYDEWNRLIRSTENDPDGSGPQSKPITELTYDKANNLVKVKDPAGAIMDLEYDSLNRVVKERLPIPSGSAEADRPVTEYHYDVNGNVDWVKDPLNRTTLYTYHAKMDWLTQVVQPATSDHSAPITTYTRDNLGNVSRVTDPLGRDTSYKYDRKLRISQIDAPAPQVGGALTTTIFTYDVNDQLLSVIDPLNREMKYRYDDLGRQISTKAPSPATGIDGPVTVAAFDKASNNTFSVDPLGNVTEYQYDARDRVVKSIGPDPDGAGSLAKPETQFQYDAAGQVLVVTDPLGRQTTYGYDGLGRLLTVTSPDPDGGGSQLAPQTSYEYDLLGRRTKGLERLTSSTNLVTQYAYDKLGRVTSTTEPSGAVTSFTYDRVGNQLTVTDPLNNVTQFFYDNLDRLKQEKNQLNASRYFYYDAVGNLTLKIDRSGRDVTYGYDRLDRRTSEYSESPNYWQTSFTYNAAGELTQVNDYTTGISSFTYDGMGRQTSETVNLPGSLQVVSNRSYNAASDRTQLAVKINGTKDLVNDYSYDKLGRMTQITQHAGTFVTGSPTPNAVAEKRVDFTYNAASQFNTITRSANLAGTQVIVASTHTYDPVGRLTGIVHSNANNSQYANHQYTFDPANRLTQYVNNIDGTINYSYDLNGQVTGADNTGMSNPPDETYTYDANGNRSNSGYTTGTNNRLTNDGTYSYLYDAEGNRIRRTKLADNSYTQYTWDHRERLINVTEKTSSGTITKVVDLLFDAFDRWVGETVDPDGYNGPYPSTTKRFVYDGTQILLAFENGSLKDRYLWGPAVDQILADEQVSSTSSPGYALWSLADHLGTVRDVVNPSSTVIDHLVYSSFGQIVYQTNSSQQPFFTFTGRPLDVATGLQNNWHRWYDARVGKWISEDPIGFAAGDGNLNRYAGNGATNYTDPSGFDHKGPPSKRTRTKHTYGLARNKAQELRSAKLCAEQEKPTKDQSEIERRIRKATEALESEAKTLERRTLKAKGTAQQELQLKQDALKSQLAELKNLEVHKGGGISGANNLSDPIKARLANAGLFLSSAVNVGQICLQALEETIMNSPNEDAPGNTMEMGEYVFEDEDGRFVIETGLFGWSKIYRSGTYRGMDFPIDRADGKRIRKEYEDAHGHWYWSWGSWKWNPGKNGTSPRSYHRGSNGHLYNNEWDAMTRGRVS